MKRAKTKRAARARNSRSHAHPSIKNQPQHFLKVYWPYLPLIALVITGLVVGIGFRPNRITPNRSILAYATEMSQSGLLTSTNTERTSHGLPALATNTKLNQAAQAKANDMVARNYWSHNTPDGQEPWIFFASAGYDYQKAGENLAYGFSSSSAAVVGWMNSPGHRANILDSAFSEVGFGFANSGNFVETGEETIVVAMYGQPQVLAVAEPETSAPAKVNQETQIDNNTEVAAEATVAEQFTSETPAGTESEPTRITRLQTLTGGDAPWSALALSSLSVLIVGLWLVKHALIVKRAFTTSEKFVMHHPMIDISVAAFVAIAVILSSGSGIIR